MTREDKINELEWYCDHCGINCDNCEISTVVTNCCAFDNMTDEELNKIYSCFKELGLNVTDKQYNDKPTQDAVNHPEHYTQGGIECIDALKAATTNKVGIEAVCVANAIKYLWRYEEKNGIEDVRKARWYIDRLIKELNESAED